jgi:Ion transport protein
VTGTSFWFLTRENWLRRMCLYIYNLAHYEDISNFMVVFSTILLTIDNPLDDPLSNKQFVLVILDYITTAVFTFESLIKMVIFGLLLNGKTSYFREPWNFLDFFVVLVSLLSYLPLGFDIKFYKSMRLLRILRPLRMIQRNQGLKIAIKSLINVLPGVLNLLLISGINLGLLAVLGINLFKGTFYSCNMANVPLTQQHLIKNLWDC